MSLSPTVLNAVPMPLVLVAEDERVAMMNQGATQLFGTGGQGRHYVTVLRQPGILDCVETAIRGNSTGTTRYLTHDNERDVVYQVQATPVDAEDGKAVLLAFQDITDLERAGEIRRDFVANVSHELKTPLTALIGFIETLRGPAREDTAARDRFLTIMHREAERMNRLVADLLSLSRVEAAERQRPTERINLGEVLTSTALALRPMAQSNGVTLAIFGEADQGLEVAGDADQLQQVFTNLLENAIKYGGSGERVDVHIKRLEREVAFRGPAVQVEVIDYGEGFDPVHIPRLTERFYRVDSHRSREMGGTGLGLAIAKHIVSRHRGRFRIESALGEGARFTVLLPGR